MRYSLLVTASFLPLIVSQQAFASEVIYATQGSLNRFNATQSGVDNQIGETVADSGAYIYPWDYNAAQQIGVNNTANVSQNGAGNLANFKQGQDNVYTYDNGFAYSFGSVSEAMFNTLNLDQMGEENTGIVFQMGNFNVATMTQSGSLNLSTVEQWGELDVAQTSQFGVENISAINQSDFNGFGGDKSASIFQNGNSNYASINQYEDYYSTLSTGPQTATIDQIGSSNSATVYQTGIADLAINMQGDSNVHVVNQRVIAPFAPENQADTSSFGDFNSVTLTQAGTGGNMAEVMQDGNQNAVTLSQNRQDAFASVMQTGDNNLLNLSQNGMGNSFQISMVGDFNSLSLTQY